MKTIKKSMIALMLTLTAVNFISVNSFAQISNAEKNSLIYMYEEEKLARDVYLTLSEKYDIPVFKNISKSEQYHMDLVNTLLEKFDITNTAKDKRGEFENNDLQKLYNSLTEQGSKSLIDALKTGATIEDVDIHDLEKYIPNVTNPEIISTFKQLTCGSGNHMRAFSRQLKIKEIVYTPQYISQNKYNKIINGEHKRCFQQK